MTVGYGRSFLSLGPVSLIEEFLKTWPWTWDYSKTFFSLIFWGGCDASFPLWLKSLMTICCCVSDCYVQNVSIFTLLEVINHSQSLALVIEDRMKRYKVSGHNPFFGKLQMVTLPPIAPGVLKIISEKTDFYQVSIFFFFFTAQLHSTSKDGAGKQMLFACMFGGSMFVLQWHTAIFCFRKHLKAIASFFVCFQIGCSKVAGYFQIASSFCAQILGG